MLSTCCPTMQFLHCGTHKGWSHLISSHFIWRPIVSPGLINLLFILYIIILFIFYIYYFIFIFYFWQNVPLIDVEDVWINTYIQKKQHLSTDIKKFLLELFLFLRTSYWHLSQKLHTVQSNPVTFTTALWYLVHIVYKYLNITWTDIVPSWI